MAMQISRVARRTPLGRVFSPRTLTAFLAGGLALGTAGLLQISAPRTAVSGTQDLLADPANRALMARFLRSIDSQTPPFPGP